jgi:hypothetical protein
MGERIVQQDAVQRRLHRTARRTDHDQLTKTNRRR